MRERAADAGNEMRAQAAAAPPPAPAAARGRGGEEKRNGGGDERLVARGLDGSTVEFHADTTVQQLKARIRESKGMRASIFAQNPKEGGGGGGGEQEGGDGPNNALENDTPLTRALAQTADLFFLAVPAWEFNIRDVLAAWYVAAVQRGATPSRRRPPVEAAEREKQRAAMRLFPGPGASARRCRSPADRGAAIQISRGLMRREQEAAFEILVNPETGIISVGEFGYCGREQWGTVFGLSCIKSGCWGFVF